MYACVCWILVAIIPSASLARDIMTNTWLALYLVADMLQRDYYTHYACFRAIQALSCVNRCLFSRIQPLVRQLRAKTEKKYEVFAEESFVAMLEKYFVVHEIPRVEYFSLQAHWCDRFFGVIPSPGHDLMGNDFPPNAECPWMFPDYGHVKVLSINKRFSAEWAKRVQKARCEIDGLFAVRPKMPLAGRLGLDKELQRHRVHVGNPKTSSR